MIPYEKLSKKKKRELNKKRRSDCGIINPATRIVKSKRNSKRIEDIVRSWEDY